MTECFRCGIEDTRARLFDVISKEGIVKICAKCLSDEDLPVVKKPTTFQLKEGEKGGTIYDRLSSMAGINSKEHLKKFHPEEAKKREKMVEQDISLRELVDRNYKDKIKDKAEIKPRLDLVDNFHWIIMRVRRSRKLSKAQLAKEISESEAAIEMAEKGILPEDDYRLVNKLESFLGIKIIKDIARKNIPAQPKDLFEGVSTKEITLGDLKQMKKKVEENSDFSDSDFEEEIILDEEIEEGEKKSKKFSFREFIFGKKERGEDE